MNSSKPLVAFFGATGGCSAAALACALNADYPCTALARTPSKLTELLLSKGVSQSAISTHLRVTQGDVRDVSAVKNALSPDGLTASIIVSGIGIYTLGKITICAEAVNSILSALVELKPVQKPLIAVISSTGISAGPRDVPIPLVPLYKIILHNGHKDKHNMEQLLVDSLAQGASGRTEPPIRGFVFLRPSLLTNGPAAGQPKLRVGTVPKPAVGYTVSREDVGKWIFNQLLANEDRDRWAGEK
ncbi:hypothetical protein MMC07_009311, partial [Pseudocyphellaria aurata]|nr:hypothetical protein [Pseudocyphellaria aurata]